MAKKNSIGLFQCHPSPTCGINVIVSSEENHRFASCGCSGAVIPGFDADKKMVRLGAASFRMMAEKTNSRCNRLAARSAKVETHGL